MSLTIIYLLAINLFTFCVYGLDKWKAQNGRWRIPESTLLGLAAVGGSLGAWMGMKTFHHKTLKNKFRIGVPVLLVIHALLLVYFIDEGITP